MSMPTGSLWFLNLYSTTSFQNGLIYLYVGTHHLNLDSSNDTIGLTKCFILLSRHRQKQLSFNLENLGTYILLNLSVY